MNQVRIGGGSEYVLFELLSHEVTDGWYEMRASVAVPGFTSAVNAFLEPTDFAQFEQQLKVLYDTLQGTAELHPCESQINVVLTGNGRGGIEVTGDISSISWTNKLQYGFTIDQTFLVDTLAQLEQLGSGV